jgi:hypothetical protein
MNLAITPALPPLLVPTRLRGLVNVAWLLAAGGQLALAVAYIVDELNAAPIRAVDFAWLMTTVGGYALVGVFVFARRSHEWVGVLCSYALVGLGAYLLSGVNEYVAEALGWTLVNQILVALDAVALLLLVLVFPDGRFVPAWAKLLSWGLIAAILVIEVGFGASSVADLLLLGCVVLGLVLQFYRYRYVATMLQRLQTRWVVAGMAAQVVVVLLYFLVFVPVVEGGSDAALFTVVRFLMVPLAASLPVALAIAILRYRLWDIDLLIRRTLTYAVLTTGLAAAYFGSVLVLQRMFRTVTGEGQSQLVTVLSTLGIAALFVPLRRRVQAFIDRRFYRRKYDAAATLAAFGASLRDEVDLGALERRLVTVVQETMQPQQVSVWRPKHEG